MVKINVCGKVWRGDRPPGYRHTCYEEKNHKGQHVCTCGAVLG